MRFDPTRPYNDLPPLPPATDLDSKAILKSCIEARSALAALKEAGDLIPNQAMLINTIPILEAKSSSAIENIVTTTDALFKYTQINEANADPATKAALRYGKALWAGVQSLKYRPLCTNTAIEICSTIKDTEMGIRRVRGTKLSNPVTDEIIYTPPEGEALIRKKLANWEAFLHGEEDIDPLVRLAVAHYQFEAIHPFTDGNGRTGRVINLLYLVERKLLSFPVLYLSRYLIENKLDYYRLLRAVTEGGDWEPWLLYMLDAVRSTASWTKDKIAAIRNLLEETSRYVRAKAPKIYSRELIDVVFKQPYCRIMDLENVGIAKRETASVYLKKLADIGVMREEKSGRDKLFVQSKLLGLLSQESNEFVPYI